MENLKLISFRIPKEYLANAEKAAREADYYQRSFVLRVAIWIGLKFMKPGVLRQLADMMWKEEIGFKCYTLGDILCTTGVLKEDEQGAEL